MPFKLPELPYAYDALEPHMSAETLEFHHDKHHNAYLTKTNELLAGTDQESLSLEEAVVWAAKNNAGLFNQIGQHYNHSMFWESLKPQGGGGESAISSDLLAKLKEDLGSYDDFRSAFIAKGMGQFGSGWVWLVQDNASGKLEIVNTGNADTPLVHGKTPLLTCDVWEHSYYIDHRNARAKYLETFVDNLLNWDNAAKLFAAGPLKVAA